MIQIMIVVGICLLLPVTTCFCWDGIKALWEKYKKYRAHYYPSKDSPDLSAYYHLGERIITKEEQEKIVKTKEREKLAKKFMIIAGLRDHWKGLHVRKYTDVIVNSQDKYANGIP